MQTATDASPKPDDLLGICAALGEDFGFDPLWLRIALSAGVLWNPLAMLGLYLTLGAAVLATRLLFPDREPAAPADPVAALPEAANCDAPELARAA